MKAWDVYAGGEWVDTVFYADTMNILDVYDALFDEGYSVTVFIAEG